MDRNEEEGFYISREHIDAAMTLREYQWIDECLRRKIVVAVRKCDAMHAIGY